MTHRISDSIPLDQHEFKPAKVIPAAEKHTWLGKHVQWLKEERHGWSKIGITAFAILEKVVLFISVIGWGLLKRERRESKIQDAKAEYFRQVEQAIPPPTHPIELKSKIRTFNHIQEFAIENDMIWMRRRHSGEEWKSVYFDGFINGRVPTSLDCDGANLIVLDEKNRVHYKKIIKEFRKQDITDKNRNWLAEAGVNFEEDGYVAVDKGDRDNWKDKWFSLPYIQYIVNLFTKKRLKIPQDARAWAISHRGRYNDYLEDQLLRHHEVKVGVTTLYVLDHNSKDIYKFDPWSPKHVKISIPLPETSKTSFEAENISTSASVIMAIGYEMHKDNPKHRTLQIYTRLADIDSEGWDPGLKYDYFDNPDPHVYIVPLPQWTSHPLALEEGDFITKTITILQTGSGNNARELRVAGQHHGQKGFFFKKIDKEEWQFEPLDEAESAEIKEENALPLEKDDQQGEFQTTVHDYQSEQANIRTLQSQEMTVCLLNFGQRSYHSKMRITIDQKEYELDLHRKKTLKNFIGFEGDTYELVIPQELHENPEIMQAFKGEKIIPLQIIQDQTQLTIRDQGSSFQFIFSQKD
jgi:hypothetical protein